MTAAERIVLPVVPLAKDTVLLPGVILRIPVPSARADILALLTNLYTKSAAKSISQRLESVQIACVPLNSPLLNKNGQNLISQDEQAARGQDGTSRTIIDPETATKDDLFRYATAAKISGFEGRGTGELALLVEGAARVRIEKFTQEKPFFEAEVTYLVDPVTALADAPMTALFTHLKKLSGQLLTALRLSRRGGSTGLSPLLARRLEAFIARKDLQEAGSLADFMTNVVEASLEEKLQVLASVDVAERLQRTISLLERQINNIRSNVKITSHRSTLFPSANSDLDQISKLNQQNQGVPSMPPGMMQGRAPDGDEDVENLKAKLDAAQLSPAARKAADKELKKFKNMRPGHPEYGNLMNYLETILEIPWVKTTEDRLGKETLVRARKQLNDDHYGLETVKKRLLEYIAVLKLKQSINEDVAKQIAKAEAEAVPTEKTVAAAGDGTVARPQDVAKAERTKPEDAKMQILKGKLMVDKSPILLLVGPPGVGKTSLARSIATALGRKFHRISLGGVNHEGEIRGHRRTYVAAMPGKIVDGLRKVGVANPVFLLDEIDKVSTATHNGDPSAALLEVLDPEQNNSFTDHYLQIPLDLSKVLFIATANSLETIPAPLLDRMETISLAGYTTLEKKHIANQHLVPKQIKTNAMRPDDVKFNDDVIEKIIESYTREAGVRNLEREIGSVCRAKAVEFSDARDSGNAGKYNPNLSVDDLEEILGVERYESEIAETTSRPGIVTGLVAFSTMSMGSILFIEVLDMPGSGSVQLTGKLGEVLKESVEVALSWVKAHAYELGLTSDVHEDIMRNRSIHVHCPAGAIPKDGPSAGIAHTIALISLFSGKAVPPTMAMTGEVSLRGRVTAVGGIKEKLIGALRAGVKSVMLPMQNRKDVKDLPQEVKDGLEIIYVRHVWEAMRHVWPDTHWPGEQHFSALESRL